MNSHHILIQAEPIDETAAGLIVKCSCGEFIMDRSGVISEATLSEIAPLVGMHYMKVKHPEQANGKKK